MTPVTYRGQEKCNMFAPRCLFEPAHRQPLTEISPAGTSGLSGCKGEGVRQRAQRGLPKTTQQEKDDMNCKIFTVAGAALALTLASSPAEAQRASNFGVSAGATLTSGDFNSEAKTGFNLGASLGFVSPMFPVGFRLDGTWHQFELEPHGTPVVHEGENYRMLSLTGNALLALPVTGLSPYLLGGVGVFNTNHADFEAENNFGYNLGGGVRFALTGFNTYAEARWTRVNTNIGNVTVVPIVFGIMF